MLGSAVPDTWSFGSVFNAGQTPAFTIPAAAPNVSHILTGIEARLIATVGAAFPVGMNVRIFDGGVPLLDAIELLLDAVGSDSDSDDGIHIGSAGLSMAVQFTAALPANCGAVLRISGYDL